MKMFWMVTHEEKAPASRQTTPSLNPRPSQKKIENPNVVPANIEPITITLFNFLIVQNLTYLNEFILIINFDWWLK